MIETIGLCSLKSVEDVNSLNNLIPAILFVIILF